MGQAEELLNQLAGATTYADEDNYVIIGDDQVMIVPEHLKKLGVSDDNEVNTIHFVGPRYSRNGSDLSKLDFWVNFMRSDDYPDRAHCKNVKVDPDDETKLHYEWEITRNVTEIHGNVIATVCAIEVDSAGYELDHWNTEICRDFYVAEGMEVNSESIINQYPDLVEYMLYRVATIENKTTKDYILNCVEEYLSEDPSVIIEQIEKIIAEQPIREYVNEYLDTYVDICTTEKRTLENSYAGAYEMISMEGVSEQAQYEGYQLFDASKLVDKSIGGVTFINNGDGSFALNGSGALTDVFAHSVELTHEETVGLLKAGTLNCNFGGTSYPNMYMQLVVDGNIIATPTNRLSSVGTAEVTQSFLDNETSFLRVGVYGSADETIVPGVMKPMIYQDGDGTWEPFTNGKPSPSPEYPQEIKSVGPKVTIRTTGKNMLGGLYFAQLLANSGANAAIDTNAKTVKLTGNPNTKKFVYRGFKDNTRYTFFFKGINDTAGYEAITNIRVVYTNGLWYSPTFNTDGSTNVFVTPEGYGVDYIMGLFAAGTAIYDYEDFGIMEGVCTLEDFEAYKGSTATITLSDELRSCGDYSDIIKKKDGKWGIERWIGLKEYNGTNNTFFKNDGIEGNDNYMYVTGFNHTPAPGLSQQFIHVDSTGAVNKGNGIESLGFFFGYNDKYLFLNAGYYMTENTQAALTEFLTEHPFSFQYVMAEPTWEELYGDAQTALENLEVYDGVTHVFVESDVQPVVMSRYGTSEYGARSITNNNKVSKYDARIASLESRLASLTTTPSARIGEVELLASAWEGNEALYSQVVSIDGVTNTTQVDLTPSVEQLAIFYEKDLTFVTENEGGVVTVYAIGQKPVHDYTIQVTMTEVYYG